MAYESSDSALEENLVQISEDFRTMKVPYGESVLGCVGDAWVRKVYFQLPRYCDGTDISEYTITVNYVNEEENEDLYIVTSPTVDDENIVICWSVGPVACAVEGHTAVSIKAQLLDGETVENEFNSTVFNFRVLPANSTSAADVEQYSDAVTALLADWDAQYDAYATATTATVESAISDMQSDVATAVSAAETAAALATEAADTVEILEATASGTVVTATTAYGGATLRGLTVYGNSTQDGTPTPSSPVEIGSVESPTFYLAGKNLFGGYRPDAYTVAGITFTPMADGGVAISGTNSTTTYPNNSLERFAIPADTTYTITASGTSDTNVMTSIYFYDSDGNLVTTKEINGSGTITFTTESTIATASCRFAVKPNCTVNATVYAQLELGSTATAYSPYTGNTTALSFAARSLPDGTRDVVEYDETGAGTVTRYVGAADMGTLNWSIANLNGVNGFAVGQFAPPAASDNVPGNIMTAVYETVSAGSLWGNKTATGIISLNTSGTLQVRDTRYTTLADFKAALSGVYIYFELATPTTATLPTIAMPTQPDGALTAWVDSDPTTTIDVTYRESAQYAIDELRAQIAELATA